MKQMVKLSCTLLIISAVVAGILAGVNAITKPLIEKINWEKTQQAVAEVLPGGGEQLDIPATDEIQGVYASQTGYAVQVAPAGFGGNIQMMVGVSKEGNVLGVSIISHSETAGLGAVAAAKTEAGEAFRKQFLDTAAPYIVGSNVDALTGATITSKAVADGVNQAVAFVQEVLK